MGPCPPPLSGRTTSGQTCLTDSRWRWCGMKRWVAVQPDTTLVDELERFFSTKHEAEIILFLISSRRFKEFRMQRNGGKQKKYDSEWTAPFFFFICSCTHLRFEGGFSFFDWVTGRRVRVGTGWECCFILLFPPVQGVFCCSTAEVCDQVWSSLGYFVHLSHYCVARS